MKRVIQISGTYHSKLLSLRILNSWYAVHQMAKYIFGMLKKATKLPFLIQNTQILSNQFSLIQNIWCLLAHANKWFVLFKYLLSLLYFNFKGMCLYFKIFWLPHTEDWFKLNTNFEMNDHNKLSFLLILFCFEWLINKSDKKLFFFSQNCSLNRKYFD